MGLPEIFFFFFSVYLLISFLRSLKGDSTSGNCPSLFKSDIKLRVKNPCVPNLRPTKQQKQKLPKRHRKTHDVVDIFVSGNMHHFVWSRSR